MSDLIISVSGLRGIVGTSLTPIVAAQYASAFHSQLGGGPIVLSRDGRTTGPMFADIIRATLTALGRDVYDADVSATPTVGVLVRHFEAAGGIQISASHNPPEYNGMKLFGSDGRVINQINGEKVKQLFNNHQSQWVLHDRFGKVERISDTTSAHLELVLSTVNVEAIRARKFTVILDSNNGAGSVLGKTLLESLGTKCTILGEQPDGQFSHPAEPTESNLESVRERAAEMGADAVFCQDPDADRLAIIDENGRYIGEEMTVAITLRHALSQRKGPVVINCATSRMSMDIANSFGCQCYVSAVGEANVTDKMIEVNAVYGGEGNGGPIDPSVGYVRDSFVAIAQTLDAMAASKQSLSQMITEIPQYAIVKDKIPFNAASMNKAYNDVKHRFSNAKANEQDGLRLDWEDSWLLIRPSNTEPIARIIAEAADIQLATSLVKQAKELISG
jgi:phosphomannomutase